jgi:hypothetical protein
MMNSIAAASLLLVPLLASCGGGASAAPSTPLTPVTPPPVLATITVSLTPATIQVGQTATAAASGFDQNGAPFSIGTPIWSSSPIGVATVSANGMVSGAAPGLATVAASVNGKQGQQSLTVVPVPGPAGSVAALQVNPFYGNVIVGQALQLVATPRDAAGSALTGRQVRWTSSDSAVATVSGGGLVSARAIGTAIIEAECEGQYAGASLTIIGEIDPDIVVEIAAPVPNQVIGDSLRVVAFAASVFPLTSVVASVGSQQVTMMLTLLGRPDHPVISWYARLDVSLLRFGPYAVTVIATDSRGHRGLTSVVFTRDAKADGGTGKPPGGSKQALPAAPPRIP